MGIYMYRHWVWLLVVIKDETLIIIQTFMYACTFVVGYSIAKLYCICQNARTSDHDDQFLNDVLQCQRQLTLPSIHILLIVQHFIAAFHRS